MVYRRVVYLPNAGVIRELLLSENALGIKLVDSDCSAERTGNLYVPSRWKCSERQMTEYNSQLGNAWTTGPECYRETKKRIIGLHDPDYPLEPRLSRWQRIRDALFG